jgi:electron transfer flavoprotein beta subunit
MKILVALKQVPDTETKIKIAADGKSLDAADVKWITGPYDEYALEEAIRIKEAAGGEVVVVTAGGESARDVLRNALALGADSAVLLKGQPGEDPLAVARMLAGYAEGKGFDLVLMGNKGIGGDNSSVGPMLAEILGWGQANVVVKLEAKDGQFSAEREIEGGVERVEGPLPAVITAQKGLNEPRYASLKGIMAAKKKTIEEIDTPAPAAALANAALVLPPARPDARRIDGDPAAQAAELMKLLKDEAKVF